MSPELQKAIRELEEVGRSHEKALADLSRVEQSLYLREATYRPALEAVSVDQAARGVGEESVRRAETLFRLGEAYGLGAPEKEEGFAEGLRSLRERGQLPSPEGLSGYIAGISQKNPELAQRLAQAVPEGLYEGHPRSTLEAGAFGAFLKREYELSLQSGERGLPEAMEALKTLSSKLPEGYAQQVAELGQKEAGKGLDIPQASRNRDYELE